MSYFSVFSCKASADKPTYKFFSKDNNVTHNNHPAPNPVDGKAQKPFQFQVVDPIGSFTGRVEFLQDLHKAIENSRQSKENGTTLSQIKVITGLGGRGKTQTLRKYILAYKDLYGHTLWINAETYSRTKDCFKEIASLCNIPSNNFDPRRAVIVDQIYECLCTGEKPCLIIFDNAESMGLTPDSKEGISPFLPEAIKPEWKKPTILVTSRCTGWEKFGPIPLPGLNENECFDLLRAQLGFKDTPENREYARQIADMFDGLPLVVQQVIALITIKKEGQLLGESAFTMKDFLNEIRKDGQDLVNTKPNDCPIGANAFTIFKMMFKAILKKPDGPLALHCLRVMSFLNPDNIPAELLKSLMAPVPTKRTALLGALKLLRRHNLITFQDGPNYYTIHRIVQLVSILYNQNKSGAGESGKRKSHIKGIGKAIRGKPKFCSISADILTSIIPPFLECLEEIPVREERLNVVIQNGLQIASHLKKHSEVEGNISFLEALDEKLEAAGKYSEAENMWKDLLAIYAAGKGTSAEKWYAKSKLAWACLLQGKYDAALKMYKEVLETKESELGTDHEDTLSTKGMMAVVYTVQGKYDDAIELHEFVLKNEEKQFGSNDCRTAVTKGNLANALRQSGKYERAIELYNDVLKYEQLQLRPNHHLLLSTKHNLAVLLQKMGKYDEAVKMFEDTLKGMESELGPDQIDTLNTKGGLASALKDKGEDQRAFQLYEETLKAQMTHLGPDHPQTLLTKHNFALLHKKLGKYDAAVEMFEDVLKRREKLLGPDHPLTIITKKVLADILYDKEEYEWASKLYEEVLKFQHSFYGPDSPEALTTKSRLAYSFTKIGKYGAAMEIYEQILEHKEKSLGPNHPDTLGTKHNMAWSLRKQGRYDGALRACEDILNNVKQAPDVIYDGTMGIKDEIAPELSMITNRD